MVMMHQQEIGLRSRVAELMNNPNAKAIALGVATVALTPIILPLIKPLLKVTLKSGLTLYEKTKEAIAETGEMLADIAAEAKAESSELQKQATLGSTVNLSPKPPLGE